MYLLYPTISDWWRNNVCVCLFPERVTICEGGVDISDSDDEDESRCHCSYFKLNLHILSVCFKHQKPTMVQDCVCFLCLTKLCNWCFAPC